MQRVHARQIRTGKWSSTVHTNTARLFVKIHTPDGESSRQVSEHLNKDVN